MNVFGQINNLQLFITHRGKMFSPLIFKYKGSEIQVFMLTILFKTQMNVKISQVPHEYLIEQLQFNGNDTMELNNNIKLNFTQLKKLGNSTNLTLERVHTHKAKMRQIL